MWESWEGCEAFKAWARAARYYDGKADGMWGRIRLIGDARSVADGKQLKVIATHCPEGEPIGPGDQVLIELVDRLADDKPVRRGCTMLPSTERRDIRAFVRRRWLGATRAQLARSHGLSLDGVDKMVERGRLAMARAALRDDLDGLLPEHWRSTLARKGLNPPS